MCRIDIGFNLIGAAEEITLSNNGTESAVVAVSGDNHKVLVAVLGPCNIDAVRQDCDRRLPASMMPSLFLRVGQLPRLANQKADLRAIEQLAAEELQKSISGTSGEEVQLTVDSLGMMRRLTKAHVKEMQWVQNQQAAWHLSLRHLGPSDTRTFYCTVSFTCEDALFPYRTFRLTCCQLRPIPCVF